MQERRPLTPDHAARLLISDGPPINSIGNDTGLALALFDVLPRKGMRSSQIPFDFDAVRAAYAAIMSGNIPFELSF